MAEMRALVRLAVPLVLTGVAQIAISTTDVILIGGMGGFALASATLTTAFFTVLLLFNIGLVSATMPMLARELGRCAYAVREVRRTVRQGLWSALILAVASWVLLWHARFVFQALGQEADLLDGAEELMHSLQWGMLPALGYVVLRSFFTALDRPLWTLSIALLAILFNLLCGWTLIYGHFGLPALGLRGAGIAGSLANGFMFVGLAAVALRHRVFRRYHLFGRFWVADWARLRDFWRLGLPIAVTSVLEASIFSAAAVMMGWLGADTLAAHAIVMQIITIFFMVPSGLSQAATVRVGRAYGRGERGEIRRIARAAIGLGAACMVPIALAMLILPRWLIGLFLDLDQSENVAVLAIGTSLLAVAAVFQVVDAIQVISNGVLRGLHDTLVPMVLAVIGFWLVGLPLGGLFAFPIGLGGTGVWLGLASALGAVALLLSQRWLYLTRPEPAVRG